MYIGPILSVPVGFAIFTAVGVIIMMIASEIWWRCMKHLPEDEENYDPEAPNHFEIMEEDDFYKAHPDAK